MMLQKYGHESSFHDSATTKDDHGLLDKDHGAEIGIRALGGEYYSFKSGVSTGWNPFMIEETQENSAFKIPDSLIVYSVRRP